MIDIRKSLSAKITISIMLIIVPLVVVSLGVFYYQSRHMVRIEAIGHAHSQLNATMQRIYRNFITVETATNVNTWQIEQAMQPDSLLAFSHRIVRLNPHIDGCSISMEPYTFPKYGKYFSVYTIRSDDSIVSNIEEQYEYFQKVWYKEPRHKNGPRWVAYYDEADSLENTLDGMIASFGRPLYDADSTFKGIISTDISLLKLAKIIEEDKPYPNSYFMITDEKGLLLVHPDTARMFKHTIYGGADPKKNADIFALGHEMTQGKQGRIVVYLNGEAHLVCYRPLPGTKWSLAVVCPDTDILAGYNHLIYFIVPLVLVGLIAILFILYKAISHTIRPLNRLQEKTQSIAEGNLNVHLPRSQRIDMIGQLENSFAMMLHSLNFHIGSVRYTSDQALLRNEELAQATHLVQEAERQKTTFIQNVSHQIRTPLNIILGFAQVLRDLAGEGLPEEEMKSITDAMQHNTKHLNRMLQMLFESSDTGMTEEKNSQKQETVSCNDVARESILHTNGHYPDLHINFETEVADDFCIQTNRLYLARSLRELLHNAVKYSDGKNIRLSIKHTGSTVQFIIENTGQRISEADREKIFQLFVKIDDLTEGLGLGLPLAKRHVENLGGTLKLDADYHDGSRFIVEMPA